MFSILILIVGAVAGFVAAALLLRFWMQAVRVRPPMSIAETIFKLSDWLVKPLRRMIPGVGGLDWASLLGAQLIVLLYTFVRLQGWTPVPIDMILGQAVLRLIEWSLIGLFWLLVLEFIFSWINPSAPYAPFVRALNDPVLRRLRRLIPPVGNLDFSLFVAGILLQIMLQILGRHVL